MIVMLKIVWYTKDVKIRQAAGFAALKHKEGYMKENPFQYPMKGPGRPQVLLIGNGLEYESHQKSWKELLEQLTVPDAIRPDDDRCKDVSFPLLYQLITTPLPAAAHLSGNELVNRDRHLRDVIRTLNHTTNPYLDMLPKLEADHIMSTNYSYCMEHAFFSTLDFSRSSARSQKRCYLAQKDGEPVYERQYRLHTCYLAQNGGRKTGLWHIHGECTEPNGIILSHDRYGRLLNRIVKICGEQKYITDKKAHEKHTFTSWPELFLYADVYVLGLGLWLHEFDLWWLIHRKQRERYSDGRIYFYERTPVAGYDSRHLLMQANGVVLCDAGCDDTVDFDTFYRAALRDIQQRISRSRRE